MQLRSPEFDSWLARFGSFCFAASAFGWGWSKGHAYIRCVVSKPTSISLSNLCLGGLCDGDVCLACLRGQNVVQPDVVHELGVVKAKGAAGEERATMRW